MKTRSVRVALATACAGILVAAGCGSSGGNSGASPSAGNTQKAAFGVSKDAALAKQVPAKIRDKGTIVVATDPTYPPDESIGSNGKTIVGMDVDLANALGKTLGLKVNVVKANFDSILPGLKSGKYDLGMSSFTDTKARQKIVDFVTYFNAGTSFYIKKGSPKVTALSQLCGKSVAVEKGTTQQIDVQKQTKKCKSSGKPAVKLSTYPDQNGANQALQSGRAKVGMADSPVAANMVKKSNGQFELSGKSYGVAPYGIAVPKGSGIRGPLHSAVQKLIDDGVAKKIFDKYGIGAGMIHKSVINGAKS